MSCKKPTFYVYPMLMQLQQHSHCMNNLTAARGAVVVVCVRVAERSLYIVNNEVVNNGNPGADVLYMQLLFSFSFFLLVCLFVYLFCLFGAGCGNSSYVWTPVAAGYWMLLSHRVYPHQSNVVALLYNTAVCHFIRLLVCVFLSFSFLKNFLFRCK